MGNRENDIIHNRAVRKALFDRWKDADGEIRCVSCGSNENIEWHHAIPIEVGGKDVITNLVPACHSCHMAAHGWQDKRREKLVNRNIKGGRKIKVPENYKALLDDYIFCKIGKIELGKRWNKAMNDDSDAMPDAVSHITDKQWYIDYLKELGIAKVINRIDMHTSKLHPVKNGTVIGIVTYANGETKEITHYNPNAVKEKAVKMPLRKAPNSCLPENYKELLNDFIFCRIGFKELLAKWNVDPKSPASLVGYKTKSWFKDYLDELGIKYCANKIDKTSQAYLKRGIVGFIKYTSGKVIDLYYEQPLEQAQ